MSETMPSMDRRVAAKAFNDAEFAHGIAAGTYDGKTQEDILGQLAYGQRTDAERRSLIASAERVAEELGASELRDEDDVAVKAAQERQAQESSSAPERSKRSWRDTIKSLGDLGVIVASSGTMGLGRSRPRDVVVEENPAHKAAREARARLAEQARAEIAEAQAGREEIRQAGIREAESQQAKSSA